LATVLSAISEPYGFNPSDASILGGCFVLSGIIGSFAISLMLDKYKCYLLSIRFITFGSFFASVGIYFTL